MPRSFLLIALSLCMAGCFPKPRTPLDLDIVRYEGKLIRSCHPDFDWTVAQTEERCGEPLRKLKRIGDDAGGCMVYENLAQALRSDVRPSPYVALCFDHGQKYFDPASNKYKRSDKPTLTSALGLASPPPEAK